MIRWILTAIALLLLLRLVLRFVFGLLQGLAAPSSGSGSGRGGATRIAGELVRDPVCGTYVPRESAIAMRIGGELRYYCSTACRDKDLEAQPRMGRAARGAHAPRRSCATTSSSSAAGCGRVASSPRTTATSACGSRATAS